MASRGQVSLNMEGLPSLRCTIRDISQSGLGLELETEDNVDVPSDTPVLIDGQGFTLDGVIRHCVRWKKGYRIGVELIDP